MSPTVGWVFPHLIKIIPHRHQHRPTQCRHSLIEAFFLAFKPTKLTILHGKPSTGWATSSALRAIFLCYEDLQFVMQQQTSDTNEHRYSKCQMRFLSPSAISLDRLSSQIGDYVSWRSFSKSMVQFGLSHYDLWDSDVIWRLVHKRTTGWEITLGKISKLKESWEAGSFIIKHNDLTALVFSY